MSGNIAPGRDGRLSEQLTAFRLRCRRAGLRVTPQRTAVYQALLQTDQHPSAEMVWRTVRQIHPNISLDTVNRTLLSFAEIGLASMMEGSGDPRRFDGNLLDHRHFRCRKCRKIFDLLGPAADDITIPDELNKFVVQKKSVYFEGVCQSCSGNT